MPEEPRSVTRRQALRSAIALVGGSICATELASVTALFAVPATAEQERFLSDGHFETLERVVDLVIPETDTPGALAAGVHRFIDRMLAEWASEEGRTRYVGALENIEAKARREHEKSFVGLSSDRQLEMLREIDRQAHSGTASDDSFRHLKNLVLFGYYSSEEGASLELRYDPVPGDYEGCVPLSEIGRAWTR